MGPFVEVKNEGRTLTLEHCSVTFKGKNLVTPEGDFIEEPQDPNEAMLRNLIRYRMPLTIIGDHREEPVELVADLARFEDEGSKEEIFKRGFGIRLSPATGRIARIILNSSSLAVNYIDDQEDHVSLGLAMGVCT